MIKHLSALPRADRWAVLALTALVVWLFREALFGGGVFFERDIHLVWHPQVEGFVQGISAGSWPLWDPSPAFGQPLLADPGADTRARPSPATRFARTRSAPGAPSTDRRRVRAQREAAWGSTGSAAAG